MKRILLIEDDKTLRENTALFLRKTGFEVETAKNGEDGLRKAYEILPDLIVCDILMPKLNGHELFRILQKNPATSIIPFIFQTAKSAKEDIRAGMQLGADDYITKPYSYDELLDSINTRLQKHERLIKIIEDKYKALLENPISGVYIYHENWFIYTNRKFSEITGYSARELTGKSFESIISENFHTLLDEKIRQLLLHVISGFDIEAEVLCKDGSAIRIELYGGLTGIRGETAIIGNILCKDPDKITDVENFLLKNIDKNELECALQNLARDESFFSGITVNPKEQQKHAVIKDGSGYTILTKRELDVLKLVVQGLTNQQIADKLFISIRTADWHRANLISKTGSKNTAELIMYAVKKKLVDV
ncbi:MAG: response regulator [Bacteroidales bacterium]